jgi:hypothetical protein
MNEAYGLERIFEEYLDPPGSTVFIQLVSLSLGASWRIDIHVISHL